MMQAKRKQIPEWLPTRQFLRSYQEVTMICLAALSVYLFIALFSFHQSDPAWSNASSVNVAKNNAGVVGAWIADVLLFLLGYLGYTLPFILFYGGWRMAKFRQASVGYSNYIISVAGFALVLIGACGLGHLHMQAAGGLPLQTSGAGGILGTVSAKFGLHITFGAAGSTLLLLTMLFVGLTLFTGLSWLRLVDNIGFYAFKLVNFMSGLCSGLYKRIQDLQLGKQAKRERSAVVAVEKAKLVTRAPIKIEPVISSFELGKKAEAEKQVNLFKPSPETILPPLELLDEAPPPKGQYSHEALEAMSRQLELKLKDFGVEAEVVGVLPGPVITRFEIQPAAGIKGSKIVNLSKDIARSLSVVSVRVVDVIPGKSVIGIEIPNEHRELVALSDILKSKQYELMKSSLTIGLGKDISGQPAVADLSKMPHLLVAGTTGSGKSVALNAMILSLLYKATPKAIRLIMIDPKMLELSVYAGIPHLLAPVVTDMKEAANALRWCVEEMERRYQIMAKLGVRNVAGYNRKVNEANKSGQPIPEPGNMLPSEEEPEKYLEHLPLIVVIIDELADMMMTTGKKTEELIARLAQKARAAGIHLVLATQRPSVDVITGLIKANVPCRIAFQVSSKIDSRTILDQMGAEALLGHGDMLYLASGTSVPMRIHGAFVSDHEVHAVVENIKSCGQPDYNEAVLQPPAESRGSGAETSDAEADPLYDEAVQIVTETHKASISYIQRRLKIGYNRAARMIEEMECNGLVSKMGASGNREVLASAPPID